ncbi:MULTISPECIES: DUF4870 family protein [Asticcacaulis]|jgi:uncharacterized membrane protein|uniref:DUF4870 domain-containing protein n=1 Tax=Asticcacaulis currens TaxID=2984210 RepID=A0ABT5ID05_9CAUL|nr:hypothetical protein [Asticcacaulis currens]MDC7694070.1 hypothetical protein [Asticcacaulis currens]
MTVPATRTKLSDTTIIPIVNYLLLFFLIVGGISGVVAITLIYLFQDEAPDWLKTHYAFQKKTFWVGILAFVPLVVLLTSPVMSSVVLGGIVLILVFALFLWIVGRCTMGFNHVFHKRPIPNPNSWLV